MEKRESILVVEEEKLVRLTLRERLHREGYAVSEAADGTEALQAFDRRPFDVVLLDLRLSDMTGLDVLRGCLKRRPDATAIVMTSSSSFDDAVEAIREGAYHYLKQPVEHDDLVAVLAKALDAKRLQGEVRRLREQERKSSGVDTLIAISEPMREVATLVEKIAASAATTVLVTGESGTGKGVVAKAIHYDSDRAERPFVSITCSALPDASLESELFGHERGAFPDAETNETGGLRLADGGTVLLDEIGGMSFALQAKLLRFLEERTFRAVGGIRDVRADVRIVAATNRDLEADVRSGRFRQDLYYRLEVIRVHMPPLRERTADIPALVEHFLDRLNRDVKRSVRRVTPPALECMVGYDWPGNVRELRNVVEHAVILGGGDVLDVTDLPAELMPHARDRSAAPRPDSFRLPEGAISLRSVERSLVCQALDLTQGNQSQAARLLGIHRDALRYRMKKFGLA